MTNTRINVLLVESDLRFVRETERSLSALTGNNIQITTTETLAGALGQLQQHTPDAVLLNFFLSDSEGLATFTKVHSAVPDLPIVMLTRCENEALGLEAVRQGAQDYLVKSKFEAKILSRVIRYAIERKRTGQKLVAANKELSNMNHELARSEEALRKAVEELRASHQELKTAQLQLIQAEKMECVGTLAAGVAHEVKNPLQTILMGLAYMGKNLALPDETISMVLDDMKDAVRRADAIVRDLLCLSAARQIEMQAQDLNGVVEHSLCFVNYDLTRSRVLVVKDLAPGLPPVRLDKAKMEQVFINLFMNSIQAMPGGGTLLLRTRQIIWGEEAEEDAPGRNRFLPGERILLTELEDTGSGIAEEKLPRIFEPFFTTKTNGMGTGLGLPVSKQIVDLHGGKIQITAAPGGGTRVTLMLKPEQKVSL